MAVRLERITAASEPAAPPGLRIARLSVLIASLAGFAAMLIGVRAGLTSSFDHVWLTTLTAWHGSPLDAVMWLASELGGGLGLSFFTVVALGVLIARGRLRAAAFVGVAFVAAIVGAGVLKAAVARPRPSLEFRPALELSGWTGVVWVALLGVIVVALWRTKWRRVGLLAATLFAIAVLVDRGFDRGLFTAQSDSLPSGHAMRSMGLAASLVLVTWADRRRRLYLLVAAVAVLLIGVSRVYLGVHYPTDVLAGWLAALAVVLGLSLIPAIDPTREVKSGLTVSPASPGVAAATTPPG